MPIPREILELRQVYQQAQIRMITIIAAKKARGNVTVYQESILRQINKELAALDQYAKTWARDNISASYRAGAEGSYNSLRRANLAMSDIVIDNRRVMLMAENVAMQFIDAHRFVGRQLNDYIRQAGIEAVSQKFATAATVKETKKLLIEKLTSHGITGIRDKAGRLIRLDAYAELVARSTTREATNKATLDQLQAHGYDLVQMSSHASPCPICAPLEGRVYSISGSDNRYPPLERAYSGSHANIHPNCLHVLTPYIEKFDDNAGKTRRDSNRSFDTDPRSKAQQDAYNAAQRKNAVLRNDRNQYERYKATLGDDAPSTFSGFRRMKTSDSDNWQQLQADYRAARAGQPAVKYGELAKEKGVGKYYQGAEPRVASGFVPARNIEEMMARFADHADVVNLFGVDLESGNQILRGIYNAQQKAGLPVIKMPFIGFNAPGMRPLGKSLARGGRNGIRFQKEIIKNPSKNLQKWQAQHAAKIAKEIEWNKDMIVRHQEAIAGGKLRPQEVASRKGLITRAQNNIQELDATKRWTFTSHSDPRDTINNLVAHEYAHVAYYTKGDPRYGLDGRVLNAIDAHRVTKIDRLLVSEYGASKPTELFAEVASAVAAGQEKTIPANVLKLYYEIVGGM